MKHVEFIAFTKIVSYWYFKNLWPQGFCFFIEEVKKELFNAYFH